MEHARDVRGLQRYMLLGQAISILMGLMGLCPIGLYLNPAWLGLAAQSDKYQGDAIWLWVGIGFVVLAIGFVVLFTRWSKRLLWIWCNTLPERMYLSIDIDRSLDSTDYSAILRVEASGDRDWVVRLYRPSWPASALQSLRNQTIPAKVYFDPKSRRPAVIETEQGLLWAMAGNSANRG
jgi:hypothetical protein